MVHLLRSHRPAVSILAVSLALSSLVSAAAISPASASGNTKLIWSKCASTFRCAVLQVPADYSHPTVGKLNLSLIELPAKSASPLGDIVLNPGGPGASGISFLTESASSFPASLRRDFNLVSFDPRGVGASDPVTCTNAAGTRALIALNPAPQTSAQIKTVVAAVKAYVQGCVRQTPSIVLNNVSTLSTVRDLDRIRIALGQSKLNYFGFSYGTYIGQLYAKLFPQNFRTMVLDGVTDPSLSNNVSDQQQAEGFERDLQNFYSWCATNSTCKTELPNGAKTALTGLLSKLKSGGSVQARLASQYGGVVSVNYGVLLTAVAASLYSTQDWPDFAKAIANALHGDGTLIAALAYSYAGLQQDGTYANLLAANTATNCEDNAVPKSISQYQSLAKQIAKVAPIFGAEEAWGTLGCVYWPIKPNGKVGPIVNHSKTPILVIGSTGDPATPYSGAVHVAKELGNAELLTRTGSGHTAYLFSSCIQNWTNQYLTTVVLPPKNTVCKSN